MKIREVIMIQGWVDGSGWSYSQCYSDSIGEFSDDMLAPGAEMDWSWWQLNSREKGRDTEITVSYYAADVEDITDAEPLAEWSIWESELREPLYMPDDEHLDSWFGSEYPVCLTAENIADLANGWSKTVEELMEQVHEASDIEIFEWGVYNG